MRRSVSRAIHGPAPAMLTGPQMEAIALRHAPRAVEGWRIVGASWQRGRRVPGFIHLALYGGGYLYFGEEWSLQAAVENARARGYDTTTVEERIAGWVQTGRGAAFGFSS